MLLVLAIHWRRNHFSTAAIASGQVWLTRYMLAWQCLILAPLLTNKAVGQLSSDASSFEAVAPIFVARCLECHNSRELSGVLDLSCAQSAFRGGDSGSVITPHDPAGSPLWQRVSQSEMPPLRQGQPQPLPPTEIASLAAWITAGAPWPSERVLDIYERTSEMRAGRDWWSLQRVVRPALPIRRPGDATIVNPVDVFIDAARSDTHLSPAAPADARTWLRRVTYATTGLAPSLEDYERFLSDSHPGSRLREIDRLHASPRFGERFGRFWVDLVRYADTSGYERDQEKPFAWRYRDWVVDSFNSDKPYDRFIVQQLAGDQLDSVDEQSVLGTGFLRLGTWNDEPNDPEEYQYERLEDLVHVTSTAFLGLTVKFARCHDH